MFSSNQDSSILGAISIDISASVLPQNTKQSDKRPMADRSNIGDQHKPGWNTSTKPFAKNRKKTQVSGHNISRKSTTPIRKPSQDKTPIRILDQTVLVQHSPHVLIHNRSQSSSISQKQALSPPQKGVKKTKLTLVHVPQTNVPQQISRISQKNPVSSPLHSSNSSKVMLGFYESSYRSQYKPQDSQHLESIENVIPIYNLQSLARAIQQETQSLDASQIDPTKADKDKMMFFSFKSPTSANEKNLTSQESINVNQLIRLFKR